MKQVFALSFFLICGFHAAAQSPQTTDTVVVNMLNFVVEESDTSRLAFNRNIERYFTRNLRSPLRGRDFIPEYATVFFVVDRDGNVLNPGCSAMSNPTVGQEVLRVAKKLSRTRIGPLHSNGKPVVAKVNINICFTTDQRLSVSKEEIQSKAAIVVVAYQ